MIAQEGACRDQRSIQTSSPNYTSTELLTYADCVVGLPKVQDENALNLLYALKTILYVYFFVLCKLRHQDHLVCRNGLGHAICSR
jgi:hypothetical protein